MPSLLAAFRREDGQNKDAFLGTNLRHIIIGHSHDTSKDNKQPRVRTHDEGTFAQPLNGFNN